MASANTPVAATQADKVALVPGNDEDMASGSEVFEVLHRATLKFYLELLQLKDWALKHRSDEAQGHDVRAAGVAAALWLALRRAPLKQDFQRDIVQQLRDELPVELFVEACSKFAAAPSAPPEASMWRIFLDSGLHELIEAETAGQHGKNAAFTELLKRVSNQGLTSVLNTAFAIAMEEAPLNLLAPALGSPMTARALREAGIPALLQSLYILACAAATPGTAASLRISPEGHVNLPAGASRLPCSLESQGRVLVELQAGSSGVTVLLRTVSGPTGLLREFGKAVERLLQKIEVRLAEADVIDDDRVEATVFDTEQYADVDPEPYKPWEGELNPQLKDGSLAGYAPMPVSDDESYDEGTIEDSEEEEDEEEFIDDDEGDEIDEDEESVDDMASSVGVQELGEEEVPITGFHYGMDPKEDAAVPRHGLNRALLWLSQLQALAFAASPDGATRAHGTLTPADVLRLLLRKLTHWATDLLEEPSQPDAASPSQATPTLHQMSISHVGVFVDRQLQRMFEASQAEGASLLDLFPEFLSPPAGAAEPSREVAVARALRLAAAFLKAPLQCEPQQRHAGLAATFFTDMVAVAAGSRLRDARQLQDVDADVKAAITLMRDEDELFGVLGRILDASIRELDHSPAKLSTETFFADLLRLLDLFQDTPGLERVMRETDLPKSLVRASDDTAPYDTIRLLSSLPFRPAQLEGLTYKGACKDGPTSAMLKEGLIKKCLSRMKALLASARGETEELMLGRLASVPFALAPYDDYAEVLKHGGPQILLDYFGQSVSRLEKVVGATPAAPASTLLEIMKPSTEVLAVVAFHKQCAEELLKGGVMKRIFEVLDCGHAGVHSAVFTVLRHLYDTHRIYPLETQVNQHALEKVLAWLHKRMAGATAKAEVEEEDLAMAAACSYIAACNTASKTARTQSSKAGFVNDWIKVLENPARAAEAREEALIALHSLYRTPEHVKVQDLLATPQMAAAIVQALLEAPQDMTWRDASLAVAKLFEDGRAVCDHLMQNGCADLFLDWLAAAQKAAGQAATNFSWWQDDKVAAALKVLLSIFKSPWRQASKPTPTGMKALSDLMVASNVATRKYLGDAVPPGERAKEPYQYISGVIIAFAGQLPASSGPGDEGLCPTVHAAVGAQFMASTAFWVLEAVIPAAGAPEVPNWRPTAAAALQVLAWPMLMLAGSAEPPKMSAKNAERAAAKLGAVLSYLARAVTDTKVEVEVRKKQPGQLNDDVKALLWLLARCCEVLVALQLSGHSLTTPLEAGGGQLNLPTHLQNNLANLQSGRLAKAMYALCKASDHWLGTVPFLDNVNLYLTAIKPAALIAAIQAPAGDAREYAWKVLEAGVATVKEEQAKGKQGGKKQAKDKKPAEPAAEGEAGPSGLGLGEDAAAAAATPAGGNNKKKKKGKKGAANAQELAAALEKVAAEQGEAAAAGEGPAAPDAAAAADKGPAGADAKGKAAAALEEEVLAALEAIEGPGAAEAEAKKAGKKARKRNKAAAAQPPAEQAEASAEAGPSEEPAAAAEAGGQAKGKGKAGAKGKGKEVAKAPAPAAASPALAGAVAAPQQEEEEEEVDSMDAAYDRALAVRAAELAADAARAQPIFTPPIPLLASELAPARQNQDPAPPERGVGPRFGARRAVAADSPAAPAAARASPAPMMAPAPAPAAPYRPLQAGGYNPLGRGAPAAPPAQAAARQPPAAFPRPAVPPQGAQLPPGFQLPSGMPQQAQAHAAPPAAASPVPPGFQAANGAAAQQRPGRGQIPFYLPPGPVQRAPGGGPAAALRQAAAGRGRGAGPRMDELFWHLNGQEPVPGHTGPAATVQQPSGAGAVQGAAQAVLPTNGLRAVTATMAPGGLQPPTTAGNAAVDDDEEALMLGLECPITHEEMMYPVVAADGWHYERVAIEKWLENHDTSPMTNEKLPHKNLSPDINLQNYLASRRAQRGM